MSSKKNKSQVTEVKPEVAESTTPAPKAKAATLTNVGIRNHSIAGKTIAPGDQVTLTKKQLTDDRLMAKVKNSIRCGILEEAK